MRSIVSGEPLYPATALKISDLVKCRLVASRAKVKLINRSVFWELMALG